MLILTSNLSLHYWPLSWIYPSLGTKWTFLWKLWFRFGQDIYWERHNFRWGSRLMTVLHNNNGLNCGDSKYWHKLNKRIEKTFTSKIFLVTATTNAPEVVIGRTIFENTIHNFLDNVITLRSSVITLQRYRETFSKSAWVKLASENL